MVNKQNNKTEAAYAEVLRDLAHDEPVSGYSRETLKLTDRQLAAVIDHSADIVGEATAEADEQIVASVHAYLASGERNAILLATIGAVVVDAIRARAPRWILSDVLNACADSAEASRVDARFAREAVSA